MKTTLLTLLILSSLTANALECTNFAGKTLTKHGFSSDWILTIEGNEPLELTGQSYVYDGLSIAFNLTDIDQKSYHLVKEVSIGYGHCRARYCPSAPTHQTKKLLLSTNGSDNEHFNCL